MTITSLGGIGGSFFTPIINFPEVAILGIGRSEKKQVFLDGKFVTRTMLPLSLSYDCLLYTSPSPRDYAASRMPSSA